MSMPQLLDTPNEILNQIILGEDSHSVTLDTKVSLSRVNRRLNRLVTPLIYDDITFLGPIERLGLYSGGWTRFPLFALSILSNQELAARVRSLKIVNIQPWPALEGNSVKRPWKTLLSCRKVVKSAIGVFFGDNPLKDTMYKSILVRKDIWSLIAFVAAYLPNLHHLAISGHVGKLWDHCDALISFVLGEPAELRKGFCSLEHFGLSAASRPMNGPPWPILAFVRLPSLRKLRGVSIGDDVEHRNSRYHTFSKLEEGTSEVKVLELRKWCSLQLTDVYHLLRAFKSLESFTYQVTNLAPSVPFRSRELHKALTRQEKSLRSICIMLNDFHCPQGRSLEEEEVSPMEFKSFEKLEHLELALSFIFGRLTLGIGRYGVREPHTPDPTESELCMTKQNLIDILPQNISRLKISQCGEKWAIRRLDKALTELLTVASERFPKLKVVDFGIDEEFLRKPGFSVSDLFIEMRASIILAREKGIEIAPVKRVEGASIFIHNGYYRPTERRLLPDLELLIEP